MRNIKAIKFDDYTQEMMRIASWFKRKALEDKEHPVVLAKNTVELEKAGIKPELLTPEFIYHMVLETAEIAFANHLVTHLENQVKSAFDCEYWQNNMRNFSSYYHPAQVLALLRNEELKNINKTKVDFVENWKKLVPKGFQRMKCNFCGMQNVISDMQYHEIYVKGKLDWKCAACKNPVLKTEDMVKISPTLINTSAPPPKQSSIKPPTKPSLPPKKKHVRTVENVPIYSAPGKNNTTKYYIFNYRPSEFIRWMGASGMTFKDVVVLFKKLKVNVSEDTVRTQLSTGKNNSDRFGPIPQLSKQETKLIKNLINKK